MWAEKESAYIQESMNHLAELSKWWDKNNAKEYLSGKLTIDSSKKWSSIQLDGKILNLAPINPGHEVFLKELITTLIVERSVCEARLNLMAQCRAEVAGKWIIPLYNWPDIEFNPSTWRPDIRIMRYEALQDIFGKNAVRDIANKIVDFANTLPSSYIPLEIIEQPPKEKKWDGYIRVPNLPKSTIPKKTA